MQQNNNSNINQEGTKKRMIRLTKLNGTEFILNSDLIESLYENPDTTVHLTNGNFYIVKESMEDIVRLTMEYKRKVFRDICQGKFN